MSRTMPRNLKGFRDFLPSEKSARDYLEQKIVEVFRRFGFDGVETPTLEYAALIMGKYGEDADRLVYTFEDRGGRKVALPYDQTVPSARLLSQYRAELPRYFRRYAIRNVFRAENPQKGRYREFRQCDIDIFGSRSPIADAEIVACTHEAFREVGYPEISIRINDRRVLIGTLEPFATAKVDVFSIIRSIDKLDKLPEERVVAELVEKGLGEGAAKEALERIRTAKPSENLDAILDATVSLGVPEDVIEYTPMLARGLDYYTGAIFEVNVPQFSSGSLAGGGRYDDLIGQLGGADTPAVGIAFGFDRMVEAATRLGLVPDGLGGVQVLVTLFDESTTRASLEAARRLRQAGFRCEIHPAADKLVKQFKLADQKKVPVVVVIGPDEASRGEVKLRDMTSGEQVACPVASVPETVRRILSADPGDDLQRKPSPDV
jgi:histidyl-tRNA synthetase